jgi:hypothetical protein
MGATQDLQQKICQKYGWSCEFSRDSHGFWFVEVTVGFNDTRRFVSKNNQEPAQEGKIAAATLALQGLEEEVQRQQAKPQLELKEAFSKTLLEISDSKNPKTWEFFWAHQPKVVGIDVEGNQRTPPVLVQISMGDNHCILEVPSTCLSSDLKRLLSDTSIVKVFCDNNSHHDKHSLGLPVPENNDWTTGSIVDLEAIASSLLGPVKVSRGLSKIMTFCSSGIRIGKPTKAAQRFKSIGRFAMIEQGKASPLKGLSDLHSEEQRYAALDAWCTLRAYNLLQEAKAIKQASS